MSRGVPPPACRIVSGKIYRAHSGFFTGWKDYAYDAEHDLYTLTPLYGAESSGKSGTDA